MTISNIRDTDLLALSHHAERLHDKALVYYHVKPFAPAAVAFYLEDVLRLADQVTAAADRIRDRLAMKDEAVSTNIRIGEEL